MLKLSVFRRRAMLKSLSDNFSKLGLRKSSTNTSESTEKPVTPVHDVDGSFETATFGMGCFWSCDSLFGGTKGVYRTRVGYCGGSTKSPTYRNMGDHTEAIEIHFDPESIKYEQLLSLFWNNHEYGLTTKIKKQYASIIFYHTDEQKKISEESRTSEQKIRSTEKIITTIVKASEFYPAEDYHQKFRLQAHKDLAKQLGLKGDLLQTSFVGCKLNGFIVGVGGVKGFEAEVDSLGLTKEQYKYVLKYVKENEGGGLYC